MESIGVRLKKLRLEKGFSLEDVHKKTKIHLNILRAIEEDSITDISPIYKKGFIKIYCKFLGVDFQEFAHDYKEGLRQETVKYIPKEHARIVSYINILLAKLSLLRQHIKTETVFIVTVIFVFTVGLFYLGKFISYKRRTLSQKAKVVASVKDTKGQESATAKAKANASATSPKPQQPQEKARKESLTAIRLGIKAKQDCYITLKVDGKIEFQGILKKARFESWNAKNEMILSIGNAAAVELEVNGKIISNLGRRGQAIKNIVITKDGMKIGR